MSKKRPLGQHGPRKSKGKAFQSAPPIFQTALTGGKVSYITGRNKFQVLIIFSLVAQKIKRRLIQKAQLKKSYSKLKQREANAQAPNAMESRAHAIEEDPTPASTELHPDRQAMLINDEEEDTQPSPQHPPNSNNTDRPPRTGPRPRPQPFGKEAKQARRRQQEQEARQAAIRESQREREARREERERYQKAMVKARSGGKTRDQRRLGRESKVLLERVQRMVRD